MMKRIIVAAASLLALSATMANATVNPLGGVLGGKVSSSSITSSPINITTTIPKLVSINGVSDLSIVITDAVLNNQFSNRVDANETFCVYSNDTAAGLYTLTMGGQAGTTTAFSLTGATSGGKLGLQAWLSDDPSNAFKSYVNSNSDTKSFQTTSGGQSRPVDLTCGGTNNANLHVGINNSDILAQVADTYTGVFTLTVAPI